MPKKKKYYIRNKKRVILSMALGMTLIVLLIFGSIKLMSGILPQEGGGSALLDKVRKDTVTDEGGNRHLIYRTGQWNLMLLNKWNPLPREMKVDLARLEKGHEVDARCKDELLQMMEDCEEAGNSPMIVSAYRSFEKQKLYYEGQVENLMEQGIPEKEARAEAAKEVAVPGASEHHLGLAVDLVDMNMQNLDKSQEKTGTQKWLLKNSWKYGFIVRYPAGKEKITGVIYEPWHYRYVGKEAAGEITKKNLCLEEYLDSL